MNVLLIAPSYHKEVKANFPHTFSEITGKYPPLGLMYIAAYVEKFDQHKVDIMDMPLEGIGPADIPAYLGSHTPDLVGVSVLSFNLIDSMEVIGQVKKFSPSIPVVAGGPHAHIFSREMLEQDGVDYVVKGEGEHSFLALLDALASGSSPDHVDGITFRKSDGTLIDNPVATINDLDELPHPNRTKTNYRGYSGLMVKGDVNTVMISTRGCPNKCIYCDRPQMGKRYRAHSPEYVLSEIDDCLSLGINGIIFFDDTLTLKYDRITQICESIIKNKMKFHWNARTRVDRVDAKLLQLMRDAGCHHLSFGIESGCQHVLEALHKGTKIEQIRTAVSAAHKTGMTILGDFMIGNPKESREDIQKTINFACSLPLDYVQFSITTPYPATPLYTLFMEEHPELGDYWREFARHPSQDFKAPVYAQYSIPPEELVQIWRAALRKFYLRPSRILKEVARTESLPKLIMRAKLATKALFGKN
jgi:radical SAM superfamily enzyme YgiQ (UPF0313 family)